MKRKALVLLSGGQDSTTTLYIARQVNGKVYALSFDYGQRHSAEILAASRIAGMAGVNEHIIVQLPELKQIGDSALLGKNESVSATRPGTNLPSSFVPGRNILFLTIAGMYAFKLGIRDIYGGMCQTDYSGYPDCRDEFIRSMQTTLSYGMDYILNIYTPLMHLTKAQSVLMASQIPECLDALAYSHTCYEGTFPPCEACPACKLRAKGFKEAGVNDPLLIRASRLFAQK